VFGSHCSEIEAPTGSREGDSGGQIHFTRDPRQNISFEKTFEEVWSRPSNVVFNRRFAVLNRSVFIFSCMCGCEFQKEGKGSFHCPECGRLLVLEWRAEDGTPEGADMALFEEKSEC
jgi:hypothetical protein